jgi:hypothetical protein
LTGADRLAVDDRAVFTEGTMRIVYPALGRWAARCEPAAQEARRGLPPAATGALSAIPARRA